MFGLSLDPEIDRIRADLPKCCWFPKGGCWQCEAGECPLTHRAAYPKCKLAGKHHHAALPRRSAREQHSVRLTSAERSGIKKLYSITETDKQEVIGAIGPDLGEVVKQQKLF